RIRRHAFAQHARKCIVLRQPGGKRLPRATGVATAENSQLSLGRTAEFRALQRQNVNRFGLARMDGERKTKIARQSRRDFVPPLARVLAAINAAMILLEKKIRPTRREQK